MVRCSRCCGMQPDSLQPPPRCSSTHSDSAIKALLDFSTSFRASGSFVGPRVRLRALQPRDKRSKCPARAPGQQGPHSHLPAPHCVLFISSHLLFMGDFLEMADACRIAHGWLRPVYVRRANQSCRLVVFQTVPERPYATGEDRPLSGRSASLVGRRELETADK